MMSLGEIRLITEPPVQGRWYHIIETTYGAWLYGDQRGFRTRHHREHVDGDDKRPLLKADTIRR
jgi:hypothetical protein